MYIVTGSAGFIGSHISRLLLESGEHVLGIDELNSRTDTRMKRWRLDGLRQHSNFNAMTADIADRETLKFIVDRIDESGQKPVALLNLAGRAGVQASVDDPKLYLGSNVNGALNMMELCRIQFETNGFSRRPTCDAAL